MQESDDERLATHIGPESCGAARKGGVEALTRERAGQVLSREKSQTPGRRRYYLKRKAAPGAPILRGAPGSCAVGETLCTYGSASHGNREIPCLPSAASVLGRAGKSKDTRR